VKSLNRTPQARASGGRHRKRACLRRAVKRHHRGHTENGIRSTIPAGAIAPRTHKSPELAAAQIMPAADAEDHLRRREAPKSAIAKAANAERQWVGSLTKESNSCCVLSHR
jgi:hypothetical protein